MLYLGNIATTNITSSNYRLTTTALLRMKKTIMGMLVYSFSDDKITLGTIKASEINDDRLFCTFKINPVGLIPNGNYYIVPGHSTVDDGSYYHDESGVMVVDFLRFTRANLTFRPADGNLLKIKVIGDNT